MRQSARTRLSITAPGAAFAIATLLAGALATTATADDEFDLSRHSVPLEEILSGGPPKDGIPALLSPQFVSAAAATWLRPDESVVGIASTTAGQPDKAYPLRILTWHEIVNDEVGDQPLAVTYCPLTGSVRVFDRRRGDTTLTLGVSGRLYDSNLLMYDHQSQSLWSQLGAKAVTGEQLESTLSELPAVVTSWSSWRSGHPGTVVLSLDTGYSRDYNRDPYENYALSGSLMFRPSHRSALYHNKDKVLGIVIDGQARAYPFPELEHRRQPLEERFAGKMIRVEFDGSSATAYVDGRLLSGTSLYWFAWYTFHPDTTVWKYHSAPIDVGRKDDVRILTTQNYWSGFLGGNFGMPTADAGAGKSKGLFIVTGSLENTSGAAIDHVKLLFELIDAEGEVVYQEQGYNRSAEMLIHLDEGQSREDAGIEIAAIMAGETDTFRMIFIGDDIPAFDHPRVSVLFAR